ncbi:MAG: thiamine phosphate synthase, partial [Magnetococcales bacterium]|nr:thiamine phosphate synthase [Magnetococcales bacterium]
PQLRVVINDRLAWVERLGADGVHVGQEDEAVERCRQRLTAGQLIGLSTHTPEEFRQAEALRVDYVGFGPIFATRTKSDTQPVRGVAHLTAMARQCSLPMVAIGGIGLEQVPEVSASGVASAAMISGLWREDWAERLTEACRLWQRHR